MDIKSRKNQWGCSLSCDSQTADIVNSCKQYNLDAPIDAPTFPLPLHAIISVHQLCEQ
jgi:hypothetical protein